MSQEHAVLTAASEEASSRYKGDWDEFNQEPVDDWGVAESERRAFVAGALFASKSTAAREIATIEELSELAIGSVVLDSFGASCTKVTNAPIGWRRVTPAVSSGAGHWHAPYLPANVLYEAAS